jgi:hypothetical protein
MKATYAQRRNFLAVRDDHNDPLTQGIARWP